MSHNHSLFAVLAHDDAAEQARVSGNRAIIAAQTRVQDRFSKFVANAADQGDLDARIGLLDDEIREVVAAVVDEYGADDPERVYLASTAVLGGGHASDCSCGFCANKGKLPGSKEEEPTTSGGSGPLYDDDVIEKDEEKKESKTAADAPGHDYSLEGGKYVENWNPEEDQEAAPSKDESNKDAWHNAKTAAAAVETGDISMFHFAGGFSACDCGCDGCKDGNHCSDEKCISSKHSKTAYAVVDGDTFVTERLDLGASKDGLSDTGSPKIDKGNVPADGLSAIDVPSKAHPVETQGVHDTPDYGKELPGPSDTGKSVDADSPLQPEHNVADETQTWTGTEGQASAITSAKLAKWQIVNT